MIKVRYVALIEVEDEVLSDYALSHMETITKRLRGEWIENRIADQVRDVFYDPRVKVTTQLADVVKLEKDRQNDGKKEG